MTTKDHCLFFKDKQNPAIYDNLNDQFNNLNLNQNNQCFAETIKTKNCENYKFLNYDYSNNNASSQKSQNSTLFEKTKLGSLLNANLNFQKDYGKKEKTANNNNSTLSLHISAYENSIDAITSGNPNNREKDGTNKKKESISSLKSWKTVKESFSCISKYAYELPRQQQDKNNDPEVMQFKASQRLSNVNVLSRNHTNMSNKERVEGEFIKPIIYGNRAYRLPEKLPNNHTHRWTVYVRSYNNEKLSNFVRKVQFKIHSDYKNPIQFVEQEPFELTETGWGEFTVQIKLYFIDQQERQVTCTHYLALHQPEYPDGKGGTYVMKENYDEIIFVNPLRKIYDVITNEELVDRAHQTPWQFENTIKEDEEFLESLAKQSEKEVEELVNAIKQIAEKNQEYREKIKEIDGNHDTAATTTTTGAEEEDESSET